MGVRHPGEVGDVEVAEGVGYMCTQTELSKRKIKMPNNEMKPHY